MSRHCALLPAGDHLSQNPRLASRAGALTHADYYVVAVGWPRAPCNRGKH